VSNTIGDRGRRVVDVSRFHKNFTDPKESLAELVVIDPAGQILQLDWKVGRLHLTGDRVLQTALETCRRTNVQFDVRKESRRKERKTLNVIPVRMANEQVNPFNFRSRVQQLHTEFAHPGPAIKDQNSAFTRPHFDTGSVASEKHGPIAG